MTKYIIFITESETFQETLTYVSQSQFIIRCQLKQFSYDILCDISYFSELPPTTYDKCFSNTVQRTNKIVVKVFKLL